VIELDYDETNKHLKLHQQIDFVFNESMMQWQISYNTIPT
jgi:hypothetical protein